MFWVSRFCYKVKDSGLGFIGFAVLVYGVNASERLGVFGSGISFICMLCTTPTPNSNYVLRLYGPSWG